MIFGKCLDRKYINMKDNICLHPFLSLYVETNWDVKFCCKMNWPLWNIKNDNLNNIRNNEKSKLFREKFLNDKIPIWCRKCSIESKQKRSYCIRMNNHFKEYWLDNNIIIWSEVPILQVKRLELNFSNLCNLSCIMCSSKFSTSRTYLDKKLWQKIYKYQKFNENILKNFNLFSWVSNLIFRWGEPFYQKDVLEFLVYLIENWKSKNIIIEFITNLTILPWINWYKNLLPKWFNNIFEILNKFKKVDINASIDWIWETYEKIRIWSKWGIIKNNIDIILQNTNIEFNVHITVQIQNIYNIFLLMRYLDEKSIYYWVWFVKNPLHLSIICLNKKKKLEIIKFYKYIFSKNKNINSKLNSCINNIINFLEFYIDVDYRWEYVKYLNIKKVFDDEYLKFINNDKKWV